MKRIFGAIAVGGLALVAASTASPVTAHGSWTTASGGHVPDGAMIAGREANGQVLFICRAQYRGGVHPGKIRAEFGGCNIPWGGREIVVREYQVLTH